MNHEEDRLRMLGRSLRAFAEGLVESPGSDRELVQAEGLSDSLAKPFPGAGIDGFLSHFVFTVRFFTGSTKTKPVHITLPVAVQTVARSKPFIYRGPGQRVDTPLPSGCTLSPTISEADFLQRPAPFFEPGKEVVWLQILNLDARGDTPLGPVRIILGETLKREYPDLFQPSLGVAQSLGRSGFPARLFFDPTAICETAAGAFRAEHGVLSYGRITEFPPVGGAVQTTDIIPLHSVDALRKHHQALRASKAAAGEPEVGGEVLGLAHPIDAQLHVSSDEAFGFVEQSTSQ